MRNLNISDDAKLAACSAYEYALLVEPCGDRDNIDDHEEIRALSAAAPLIVAAELERMRRILARLWPDPFGEWSADQAHAARVVKQALIERLESRASELRGDKPECTCDYGAVAPGVAEPPTTDPGCPEHGSWHDTRFGPPSRHAGTYDGCLACESRQQTYDPLLREEPTTMDPAGVTAQPMDGRCEP